MRLTFFANRTAERDIKSIDDKVSSRHFAALFAFTPGYLKLTGRREHTNKVNDCKNN